MKSIGFYSACYVASRQLIDAFCFRQGHTSTFMALTNLEDWKGAHRSAGLARRCVAYSFLLNIQTSIRL